MATAKCRVGRRKGSPSTSKKVNRYRSGFEKKAANNLESRGIKFLYEAINIPYVIPASTHRYVPDLLFPNGMVCELKGKFDARARKKMSLVIEQNPDIDIRIVFMRDNTLSKQSKLRYTDWCAKQGIICHVSLNGEVPIEWLV